MLVFPTHTSSATGSLFIAMNFLPQCSRYCIIVVFVYLAVSYLARLFNVIANCSSNYKLNIQTRRRDGSAKTDKHRALQSKENGAELLSALVVSMVVWMLLVIIEGTVDGENGLSLSWKPVDEKWALALLLKTTTKNWPVVIWLWQVVSLHLKSTSECELWPTKANLQL